MKYIGKKKYIFWICTMYWEYITNKQIINNLIVIQNDSKTIEC